MCDVGRSTKGKHKFGYIGQKGIGFKSVFRVTDRPEIHSNGYHICFDVNSGPMGFILPHWIDQSADSADEQQQNTANNRCLLYVLSRLLCFMAIWYIINNTVEFRCQTLVLIQLDHSHRVTAEVECPWTRSDEVTGGSFLWRAPITASLLTSTASSDGGEWGQWVTNLK